MMIKVVDDKPELVIELRKRIQAYKRMHPNLTSQQIAKRFGVSNATFNRLENLNLKKPSLDQVIKILRGLGNNEDLIDFLRINYPDVIDSVEKHVDEKRKSQMEAGKDIVRMMSDNEDGKVFRYIQAKNGRTERSEIEFIFGPGGLKSLDRLHSKNYIYFKDQKYFVEDGILINSFESFRSIAAKEIEQSYNAKGREKGEALNFLTYMTATINPKKTMPILVSEFKQFYRRIYEILSNEENFGDTPIWMVGALDTMIENELMKEIQEEENKR